MAYECVSHICSAICSCLLGFNFHQEQRSTTPQIQTPSDTPNTEEIPPSASTVTTNTEVIPSSSSSPSASPLSGKITYDVFLSFRGEDTRTSFTDHLYTALTQKGINTFRDDEELKRGESIGPNLLKAIEESRYAVVVFSQNYADSTWCLDEIVKVADCMKTMGQKVLPVFYHIDPSEVRKQRDHFGKAFEKHQERFHPDKVQRWKDALLKVGNLSGWHQKDGSEAKIIQEIVEMVFTELNKIIFTFEGLVGMEYHLNKMFSYLDVECPDVQIIGICGMGGVGKSVIAHEVFRRVKSQFEGDSFLENVREVTEKQGAVHLQQQLLLNLLKTNVHVQTSEIGKGTIRNRLRSKKVLLILDNVDHDEQLEALCDREWFGPGSRIIITTRDEHLLREADKIYNVNPLTDDESLELFCIRAFKKDRVIKEEFLKLSKEFLKYANGLPLAIKVLGSSVHGKNVKVWHSALGRLKINPPKNVIDVLRSSFDGLEETEKEIFLDVACFFKGESINHVTSVLQGGGYSPDIDIEVLLKKSFITLFGKKLEMHDLLQELGREIVRQECRKEPGKRSRLWLSSEIIDVLGQSKATSAIQSIFLKSPTKDDVHLIDDAFSKMDRLRLLKIWNVEFSGNIGYLSNDLQYLEWHGFPLDSFPSDFQPDKLVEVHMYCSRIKQLWRGEKGWRMLQRIDLRGSNYLNSTPDFTEVPDLEELVLENCTRLVEIHPSLGFLKKLISLNMGKCESIESIPPFSTMESLQILILSFCSGLKKFPEIAANMKNLLELRLDRSNIEELPPSIEHLTGLTILDLTDCKNLLHLPNTIGCLTSLKNLYLTGCSKLDEIPQNLNGIKCLEKLSIDGTSIRELSFTIGMVNLGYLSCRGCTCLVPESCKDLASLSSLISLDLSYCNLMDGAFLNDLSSLISLRSLDLCGNCFVRLPESISQFSKLEILKLGNCRQLQLLPKELPLCLRDVFAENCTSLADYPDQIKVLTLQGQVTIVNSLNSTNSAALVTISREWHSTPEGFLVLYSIHEYADGRLVTHLEPVISVDIRDQKEECGKECRIILEDEIPEWFSNISTRNPISISIPGNLSDDTKFRGFAACAIFSVKGHNSLSTIQPDPDFLNYTYQMTMETDVMCYREEPLVLRMDEGLRHFDSDSHMLLAFYIPGAHVPQGVLNKASELKTKFDTTNPSMVVQKCAIRLVYERDEGWFHKTCSELIPGGRSVHLEDTDSEKETDWLTESGIREKCIPPLEDESSLVLRKNLESVLPRYLEALHSDCVNYHFNLRGRPGWFHEPVELGADHRRSKPNGILRRSILRFYEPAEPGADLRESKPSRNLRGSKLRFHLRGSKLRFHLRGSKPSGNLRGRPSDWIRRLVKLSIFRHLVKLSRRERGFTSVPMELPENLHKSKKWMGFAVFASLVEKVGQTMKKDNYNVFVGIVIKNVTTIRICSDDAQAVWMKLKHVRPLSEKHHQLLVIYMPRAQIPEAFFTSATDMEFYVLVHDSPHVEVQRCGYRTVYQEDIQGFSDTIIRCMQREDSLEFHDKVVTEDWIKLIRSQGVHIERMTKKDRDSRTPREKYFDLHSQKYRNWDWASDPDSFGCRFERADMSKWKWFMPFVNQGTYAEIPVPPNLFDDDTWLGFAVCCWLSYYQEPKNGLASLAWRILDDITLHVELHSDIECSRSFRYCTYSRRVGVHLTWFHYIPRTKVISKRWRQCKLAGITVRLTNHPFLSVHSCALRLVFKEDVEHLVQTLSLAEFP